MVESEVLVSCGRHIKRDVEGAIPYNILIIICRERIVCVPFYIASQTH